MEKRPQGYAGGDLASAAEVNIAKYVQFRGCDASMCGSSADAGVPWHLGKGAAAIRTPRALDDDPGDVLGASSAPAAAPKKRFLGRRGKEK